MSCSWCSSACWARRCPCPTSPRCPGPTYNTLGDIDGEPIISVEGRERNDVRGNLNLTTVGVSGGGLSLVQAVRGWFDDEVSVVPEESVYPPDRSEEETRQANREAFLTSEQAAQTVALGHLGYPEKVVVQGFAEDSPSEGALEEGDALEAVDGRPTPDTDALDEVLTSIPGGSEITVGYTRLGRAGHRHDHDQARRAAGRLAARHHVLEQPSAPFDVDIQVEDVGGPSAGLMLTLGIIDLVGDDDLTGGAVIAGHRHDRRGRERRADRRHPAEDGRRRARSTPTSSWCRPATARRRSARPTPASRWPASPPSTTPSTRWPTSRPAAPRSPAEDDRRPDDAGWRQAVEGTGTRARAVRCAGMTGDRA